MISFEMETLNSGANPQLQTPFITFDVAITTFKCLLNMVVLKECLNRTDMEKVGFELCTKVYLMYLCRMSVTK